MLPIEVLIYIKEEEMIPRSNIKPPPILNQPYIIGSNVPLFNNFKDITIEEYNSLSNNFKNIEWNFENEAIKYCKLDCLALHQVLTKFNKLVYNKWKINIHESLTLPSLAMKIFKVHHMPENSVYQLHSIVEQNIRQSYTGGAVDVYIPHNRILSYEEIPIQDNTFRINSKETIINITDKNDKLFIYDVNSLYPSCMHSKNMPVGKPIVFNGDIRKVEPDAFGFFYCKIKSPAYLKHPIIQRRLKTVNGIRTIAGLGEWEGWIFSEEMDNAIKIGYKFTIIKGYEFKQSNIFEGFIDELYQLRLEYPKDDPMNLIAKLLMNSSYGKFGMKDETTNLEILHNLSEFDKETVSETIEYNRKNIIDLFEIDDYVYILTKNNINYNYNENLDIYFGSEINIAIASSITSYSKIHMSYFKNNPNFNLYYSDTDSAVIDSELPDHMVGNKLGQVKLEHIVNKAIFLAPKVYAIITEDEKLIIKVKGLTKDTISSLNFKDFEDLLVKDSIKEFTQEKWFKSIIKGEISTSDMIYTLKVTSNKREIVYINNIFENTEPLYYENVISQIK